MTETTHPVGMHHPAIQDHAAVKAVPNTTSSDFGIVPVASSICDSLCNGAPSDVPIRWRVFDESSESPLGWVRLRDVVRRSQPEDTVSRPSNLDT